MNFTFPRASIDDVLKSYGEYLALAHPPNFKRFQNTLVSSRESAIAEAMVFQILDQLRVNPQINDTVEAGGADFICNRGYRSGVLQRFAAPNIQDRFVVEATSLDIDAVTDRSGIPDEIEDLEGGPFSLLTLRNKVAAKAPQLANYDMPRVLAIASSHSGISALFNTATAEWFLTSPPKWRMPIDGGEVTQVIDLGSSVFLKPGPAGTIEACRQSISAILLVSIHGDRSCVCGILHPDPARPLSIGFLPTIPFVRLAKWPIAGGKLETEWVISEPEMHDFRHERIRPPKREPQGILLNVDPSNR
jgi:hypothetical protein